MKWVGFFLLSFVLVFHKSTSDKEDFILPLDIPVQLSGTFGEIRTNHFHSGIDFRTQQKENLPVKATQQGFVSRIKISTYGYGKAIYITHPNGYTTVYAHLNKAEGAIEHYIQDQHYLLQKFEMDLFLPYNQLKVSKGQVIGWSGNTGGSGGPHLHYEVRDTKTENILNPLDFGVKKHMVDTRVPIIDGVRVHPLKGSVVNNSSIPIKLSLNKNRDNNFLASKIVTDGAVGFSISTYDVQDGQWNKNGVYSIKTFVNGVKNYEMIFDTFSFDETRHVNHHVDYACLFETGVTYQKLFTQSKFGLSLSDRNASNGIVEVLPNLSYVYRIEVSDFHGNTSKIEIPIGYGKPTQPIIEKKQLGKYKLWSERENLIDNQGIEVYFPEGSLYEDVSFDVQRKGDAKFQIADRSIALRKSVKITFRSELFKNPEKTYLSSIYKGRKLFLKTKFKEGEYVVYSRDLGDFELIEDNEGPVVKAGNFTENEILKTDASVVIACSDLKSGIKSYNGWINGNWVLFEYDYKNERLIHHLQSKFIRKGQNEIKIEVVDNVGNSTIFETYFRIQ